MNTQTIGTTVRYRMLGVLPGLLVFAVLGLVGTDTWSQPWLSVGVAMAISATFVEPHFATPRSAIVNGAGALVALAVAQHSGASGIWLASVVVSSLVLLAGLIATLHFGDRMTAVAKVVAIRLGKAIVVGGVVLGVIVIAEAAAGVEGFELLALGSAILVTSIALDWRTLVTTVRNADAVAEVVAAVGPKMILLAAPNHNLGVGTRVNVRATRGMAEATIVARLPHAQGVRYQIALAREWTSIGARFPEDVELTECRTEEVGLIGAIEEGSTQRSITFEPVKVIDVGAPVTLHADEGQTLLYQVSSLQLVAQSWRGADAVRPRATAKLVGWPEDTKIRGGSHLPTPHQSVYLGDGLTGELPADHHLVGHVAATSIPVGIQIARTGGSHLGILGMSGMGKTVATTRLASALGADRTVIALDTTGEYGSRLGFPTWTPKDFITHGHFVYEPQGVPPSKAAEFISQAMRAGFEEYSAGDTPQPRTVILEEAHTFLPEFPMVLREQQKFVSESTRFVMQARKFGLTFVIVSQRTAVVSKSALSQCENYVILKTLDKTSLEYFESLVGPEMRGAIPGLNRFEAVCVGPAFNVDEPVIVHLEPGDR